MSTTAWIVIGVIVVIVIWAIMIYNNLVAMRQRVDQAFADIDVQLKQRHDLIPNLVETVKGYATPRARNLGGRDPGPQRRHRRARGGAEGRRPRTCCPARCGNCSHCRRAIRT